MKMKRIISTALTVVLLLTSILAVLPVGAFAALSAKDAMNVQDVKMDLETLRSYIDKEYIEYNFATAAEMLDAEMNSVDPVTNEARNLLVSTTSSDGKYTIYINRYTGFVYYVNNVTGEIFTSNPIDPKSTANADDTRKDLMSQIKIEFTESVTSDSFTYYSTTWAAYYSQISVSKISGGLRVNYTLGDTSRRFLLPGRINAQDFHDYIFMPMLTTLEELYEEAILDADPDEDAEELLNKEYEKQLKTYFKDSRDEGRNYTDKSLYYEYLFAPDVAGTVSEFVIDVSKVDAYLEAMKTVYNTKGLGVSAQYKNALDAIRIRIINLLHVGYSIKDANSNSHYDLNGEPIQGSREDLIKAYPICETTPIYEFATAHFLKNNVAVLRQYSEYITQYCPDYSFELMYENERECGFDYSAKAKPVFRCALEYTFNSDGSLSVRLPANSISFDETTYILNQISILPFFGAADMSQDGYLFYPDGSGSILSFDDFYSAERKTAVNYSSKVYGHDYCYSLIEGAHREQVTMPVYGMVSTTNANQASVDQFGKDKIRSGCFVVVEEGNAHATLAFESGGATHRYIFAYAKFSPYPIDKYELADAISVGAANEWNTVVGETRYSGSYSLRIVMLTDPEIGDIAYGAGNYYASSYSGMAAYYRAILTANGTLGSIMSVEENIPLYIEALGAMTITDKFLTFPVEKSIPLTTFNDIETIYNQLSKAEEQVVTFYNECMQLANEAENELLKIEYLQKAEKYKALIGEIENVKNINFKLTGFANGGMNSTYPTKLKWEKCCGGKSDFKDLIATSEAISEQAGYNFGIFPDFDFLYISNTSAFDGISNKGNVSRLVDNRYASKQVYNSLLGEFETVFAMVISADTLKGHFETFNKKYSKFEHSQLSVSTLGSDLNSNFDEKNTVDRDKSLSYVVETLEAMVHQNGYELMIDTGNIYAAKYADHILNLPTDYSAFRFSSYSVPFVGMILHGHVSYTGSPLNYSGSPAYDVLRAIESGANPYYIVAFQNNAYMKDDPNLNKYYGVDYENWYDEILTTYTQMNSILKGIQDYEIVDHTTVIVERTAENSEKIANYNSLKAELIALLRATIVAQADEAIADRGSSLKLVVNVDSLYDLFVNNILSEYKKEIAADTVDGENALREEIRKIAVEFATEYTGDANTVDGDIIYIDAEDMPYQHYSDYSQYSFTTNSTIFDDKSTYSVTDYTLANDHVVLVTYKKGNSVVRYLLNYNLFDVSVKIDGNADAVKIPMYGYYEIK